MTRAIDAFSGNASATNNISGSEAITPTKYPQLFYSPDYKQLFNKEIKEITMELLQVAEVALSSFDYRTINSIADFSNKISYDNFGNVLSRSNMYAGPIINQTIDSFLSNSIQQINTLIVSPIKDLLQIKPNKTYSSILENYGYHRSGPDIIKYLPGYKGTQPYYDLELNVGDIDGVIGYNIHMVQEVE